jgi:hypothetical protein
MRHQSEHDRSTVPSAGSTFRGVDRDLVAEFAVVREGLVTARRWRGIADSVLRLMFVVEVGNLGGGACAALGRIAPWESRIRRPLGAPAGSEVPLLLSSPNLSSGRYPSPSDTGSWTSALICR